METSVISFGLETAYKKDRSVLATLFLMASSLPTIFLSIENEERIFLYLKNCVRLLLCVQLYLDIIPY